jgi:hypothetical protein
MWYIWGTWPWTMCPHTSKNRSKWLAKSYETKQYHKKLIHTILKGLLNEWHDEHAKVKINAFHTKITFMSKWKSLTKVGRLTFCNEWKRWKVNVISSNGTTKNFKANTRTAQRYFSTCVALVCNTIVPMEVEKDQKPSLKIFKN